MYIEDKLQRKQKFDNIPKQMSNPPPSPINNGTYIYTNMQKEAVTEQFEHTTNIFSSKKKFADMSI